MMKKTHQHWMEMADHPEDVITYVAVNTTEQAKPLEGLFKVVYICGDVNKGVAFPSYVLAKNLVAKREDIVILASDDFYAPKSWDTYLREAFSNWDGGILVDDGYQRGGCVTIPIMTFNCLKRLNRIIYHPIYRHLWSDNELYINLRNLKLLKDFRKGENKSPLFEHKHYDAGKRPRDEHDLTAHKVSSKVKAKQVYSSRIKMKINDRLKIENKWVKLAKNVEKIS